MSTGFDFDRLGKAAGEQRAKLESSVYDRAARVSLAFGGRLFLNENDDMAAAVEMLLGCKPGGVAGVAELLKLATSTTTETPALGDGSDTPSSKEDRPLQIFNDDGTPSGIGCREKKATELGYGYKLDADGKHIGWQKPSSGANAKPATNLPTDLVPWHNAKDEAIPGRMISISDGFAKELKVVPDPTAPAGTIKVLRFKDRSRFVRR
jgi:hypothetical protein